MYRPQRAIETPPGYRDETYAYPIPGAQFGTLDSQQQIIGIPIEMDRDYDFYLCGIAFAVDLASPIGLKLRDPQGNYLSDDFCSVTLYAYPASTNQALGGGFIPIFEPPVLFPAGSIPLLDLINWSTDASTSTVFDMELRGFKRVKVC